MSEIEFWSGDRRFGMKIGPAALAQITQQCSRSHPSETGGVLVGFYTDTLRCAVVTGVSGEPADSRKGRSFFFRGVAGLQRWLATLWYGRNRRYYLGEWHFHPAGPAEPSGHDIAQMKEISQSAKYHCPEPLLVIVGGEPPSQWDAKVFVFPKGREFMQLYKCDEWP